MLHKLKTVMSTWQWKQTSFLLTIGDEGAILMQMRSGKLVQRLFAERVDSAEAQQFLDLLAQFPKASIAIFFDVLDQSYVQQTLPPVSRFSVGKLMKRRLEREFGDDYIKAATLLGREPGGRKDWQFMMVALQRTQAVNDWLALAVKATNRCRGIYMLPVECGPVIMQLRKNLSAQDGRAVSDWQFLVSYNRASGLRQMVFRDGKIMLTRLSQPNMASNPAAVAGALEQEISSTIEYLRRLFYQDLDTVDMTVIVGQDVKPLIDLQKIEERHLVLTPFEAATLLDYTDVVQEADRYGDVLLTTSAARGRPSLRFSTAEMRRVARYYYALWAETAVGAVAAVYLSALILTSGWAVYALQSDLSKLENEQAGLTQTLDVLTKKAAESPEDLEKIVNVVTLYDQLVQESYSPLPFFSKLSGVLPSDVRIRHIDWTTGALPALPGKPTAVAQAAPQSQAVSGAPERLSGKMVLDFANKSLEPKTLQQSAYDIVNALKTAFPEYEWAVENLPGTTKDSEQMEMQIGASDTQPKKEVPQKPEMITVTFSGTAGAAQEKNVAQGGANAAP